MEEQVHSLRKPWVYEILPHRFSHTTDLVQTYMVYRGINKYTTDGNPIECEIIPNEFRRTPPLAQLYKWYALRFLKKSPQRKKTQTYMKSFRMSSSTPRLWFKHFDGYFKHIHCTQWDQQVHNQRDPYRM